MSKKKSKLVLGTVRFTGIYGLKNNNKLLKFSEVKKIIECAKKDNIHYLDTAINYKKTNDILSKINLNKFEITSKLPKINAGNEKSIKKMMFATVKKHLKKLKKKRLYALYLHNPDDLFGKNSEEILYSLKKMKSHKIIKKIGFSIYSESQLFKLLNIFKPDIIQLPLSIFDNRFRKKNIIQKLIDNKIEVHVRSIFFQGGLLGSYGVLKKKLFFPKKIFSKWQIWLKRNNLNKIRGSLSILHNLKKIKVVVGVETKDQLVEITNEIKKRTFKPLDISLSRKILTKLYNYKI